MALREEMTHSLVVVSFCEGGREREKEETRIKEGKTRQRKRKEGRKEGRKEENNRQPNTMTMEYSKMNTYKNII